MSTGPLDDDAIDVTGYQDGGQRSGTFWQNALTDSETAWKGTIAFHAKIRLLLFMIGRSYPWCSNFKLGEAGHE